MSLWTRLLNHCGLLSGVISLVVECCELAGLSSLIIEWCELVRKWCEFTGHTVVWACWTSQCHWCGAQPGFVGVLFTTAWDPAPVGTIALCPLVAPVKVKTLANLLACIVGGSLHMHQMVEEFLLVWWWACLELAVAVHERADVWHNTPARPPSTHPSRGYAACP